MSNRAFLCWTWLFCVEPCILLSNLAFLCRTSVIILVILRLYSIYISNLITNNMETQGIYVIDNNEVKSAVAVSTCTNKKSIKLKYWMHEPEARFSNYSLPAVQIRWEVRLIVVPLLAIRSQQIFAHATTAQLSCHVQNFVAIKVIVSGWEWNVISTEFELRWKNRQWKGAQNGKRQQSVPINHMSHNLISFMSSCGSIYNCLPRINSPPESLKIVGAFHLSQEGRTQGDFIDQQTVI